MRRPNVLILYTDQQRWNALGANGNRDIKTPHLDRLAAEGVNFDRYFVQNPVCMPSRVSFLTGQYPSTLGITRMGVPVPTDTITLPRLLKTYGYRTANVGKLHFQPHANRDHRALHPDYGFDHLEISDEPGCYDDAYRAWVQRKAPDQLPHISVGLPPASAVWQKTLGIHDNIVHPAERFPNEAQAFRGHRDVTHSAFVAEQTIEFLRAQRDAPWLCIAGFYSPHSPWVAPREFLDLYDPTHLTIPTFPPEIDAQRDGTPFSDAGLQTARHGYYAMISEVDHHVGTIIATLDSLGLTEETLVIFTSDHGDWLGEHLRHGKGYPAPDVVSRVPLLVRWPGHLTGTPRTVSGLVEAIDMVPTILDLAGIQIPPHLQGQSLAPVLEGRTETTSRRSALTEHAGWKALRTDRYRYLCESNGKESLWDLAEDPGEYCDLASQPDAAPILAEHRRLLLQHLLEAECGHQRVWPY